MTNETTASQPKSIGDDAQFVALLDWCLEAHISGVSLNDRKRFDAGIEEMIAYIDQLLDSRAPAAQASATIQAAPDKWSVERLPGSITIRNGAGNCLATTAEGHDAESIVRAHNNSLAATIQAAPDVAEIVNRFLGWKLPTDFHPDAGISFDGKYGERWGMPSGTNLLNADQAKAMFKHCLAATIPEPVMVAEPVGDLWRLAEGDGHEIRFNAPLATDTRKWIAYSAAPMVAEPVYQIGSPCGRYWKTTTKDAYDSTEPNWRRVRPDAAPMVADPAGVVPEAFKSAFLKWNGFHTEAEIAAEWAAHGGLCGTFFREGLAATVKAVPSEAQSRRVGVPRNMVEWAVRQVLDNLPALHPWLLPAAEDILRAEFHRAAPLADKTGGGE